MPGPRRPHNLGPARPKRRRPGPATTLTSLARRLDRGQRLVPTPATQAACQAVGVVGERAVGAAEGRIGWPRGTARSPPVVVPTGRAHTPSGRDHHGMRPCAANTARYMLYSWRLVSTAALSRPSKKREGSSHARRRHAGYCAGGPRWVLASTQVQVSRAPCHRGWSQRTWASSSWLIIIDFSSKPSHPENLLNSGAP